MEDGTQIISTEKSGTQRLGINYSTPSEVQQSGVLQEEAKQSWTSQGELQATTPIVTPPDPAFSTVTTATQVVEQPITSQGDEFAIPEKKPKGQLIFVIIASALLLAIIITITIFLLDDDRQSTTASPVAQFDNDVSQQVLPQQPVETPVVQQPVVETEELDADKPDADALFAEMGVVEDYRTSFEHGTKTSEYQKYIVLHDTEGWGSPSSVIDYWDGTGTYVAAHFIVGTDGTIYQCVPLDEIAHHAGWGSRGHNAVFGVEDESRDDMRGTTPYGSSTDYGMNSYSVGIEMVHVGDGSGYPQAQLDALDKLIAYIDAYYGFESDIISHNDWAIGNSDTSAQFEGYLNNYKDHRSYQ